MRYLRIAGRIIVGLVFIFSGVVKAIDPLGSAYKFHDYFLAFNLAFLDWLALPLAIMLCTAEFLAGFSVLTGIRHKTGIWIVLLLMAVFTPLTLFLALTNPVSDCGCFGDAVHLTNWQTFGKNIVITLFALIVFAGRNKAKPLFSGIKEWLVIVAAGLLFILFALFNLRYLPVIDFLPYKKGIKIADKMVVPPGAPLDEYSTSFIYEKDGVRKEFTLENYPANDSTWKFIDQKSQLVKKGYVPPIHDFSIRTTEGNDITGEILSDSSFILLMISKKLEKANPANLEKGFMAGKFCIEKGFGFYAVTASGSDEILRFSNGLKFCTADETTLKTIVRANPGYVLLKNGVIIEKWSWANIPDNNRLAKIIMKENQHVRNDQ
jgi:hypothetical protein